MPFTLTASWRYPQLAPLQSLYSERRWTSWLLPDPTVERLDLDEGSWVDVVRGLVPRGDEVHDSLLSSVRSGSRVRCSATSAGSTRRGRWPPTRPARNRRSTRSTPGCAGATGCAFGAPALALYRNERDSVAFHRDRELRLARRHGDRRAHVRSQAAVAAASRSSGRRNDVDDDIGGRPRLLPRQRRPAGDGRGDPGAVAARRPQGARPLPDADLRAVALHVTPWQPRHEPVVLRRPPLQQVATAERVTTVSMIVALARPPPSHIVCRP